ncbi:MarR family transcriptional regulator [Sporolactobacillus terrae]|uniref:MarR family transcriptional regulator n=1 Tax=Sporolactobacillus terrae TaxID=269673 RepID=UPI001CBF8B55|nr:helix-turn-helix domain-containing protein [Sporolactobacillus terrae]UAK18100.1 MarR family transcriptional regulator [Sporolactobacillus terrae]
MEYRNWKSLSMYWGALMRITIRYLIDCDLSGSAYKVLFYVMDLMGPDNIAAGVRQKNISDDLHLHKSNVSKCVKELIEKQFIVKTTSRKGFMVNPALYYLGKDDRIHHKEVFDELVRESGRDIIFEMTRGGRVYKSDEDEYIDLD